MKKSKKLTYRQREKFARENGYEKLYPYTEINSNVPRWYKNGSYYRLSEIIK